MSVLGLELPHVLVRGLHVVVADLLQDLFQVRHRLPSFLLQVIDLVILMLLEQAKQLLHDDLFVVSGHFAVGFLLGLPSNVGRVVRSRFVSLNGSIKLDRFPGGLDSSDDALLLELHVGAIVDWPTFGSLNNTALQGELVGVRNQGLGVALGVRKYSQSLMIDTAHHEFVFLGNLKSQNMNLKSRHN